MQGLPLVFQRFSEPVGVIAPVGEHPFGSGQTAQQGCCASVISDLAFGHEDLRRTPLGVRNGMQLGVHAALRPADQTTPLVA